MSGFYRQGGSTPSRVRRRQQLELCFICMDRPAQQGSDYCEVCPIDMPPQPALPSGK